MTTITANIILLVMCGVWAWLSVTHGVLQPVSDNFIFLGGVLAAGEIGATLTSKIKGGEIKGGDKQ